eukprot:gene5779-7977_t
MMNLIYSVAVLALVCNLLMVCNAGTSIQVSSDYKKEVNIKIQGAGVGGCDVILEPNTVNSGDCWCLWGTINYSFCAYTKDLSVGGDNSNNLLRREVDNSSKLSNGRCPVITGEKLVCSDLTSLGNCYNGAYSCTIDSSGLCHCETI